MPESAREFKETFKPTMLEMNAWWTSRSDEDDEWAKVYMLEFAEAYASSRVAALEQRIAELEGTIGSVEAAFARRPALDEQKTLADKAWHACESMARTDRKISQLESELQLARLREVKG